MTPDECPMHVFIGDFLDVHKKCRNCGIDESEAEMRAIEAISERIKAEKQEAS